MGIFQPANMIITFANVIFFMIVQTLFFKFVASKQFNEVLNEKVGIFNEYLKYNKDFKNTVTDYLESNQVKELQSTAKQQEQKRESENMNLIKKWIGTPLVISVVILLFFLLLLFKQSGDKENGWSSIDTAILTLVVGAYSTEIMFYLGIVSQYEFYGDQQIYSRLYDGVHNNITRKPVTKEGKVLNVDIKKVLNGDMKVSNLLEKHPNLSKDFMKSGIEIKSQLTANVTDIINNF
jgi:ABC-type transport system involved in cytochrome bd biosynthesis fused ATPase/permease subunit